MMQLGNLPKNKLAQTKHVSLITDLNDLSVHEIFLQWNLIVFDTD